MFFRNFWNRAFEAAGEVELGFSYIIRFVLVSKLGLIIVIGMLVVPLTAFEAHVINVTAKIEKRPCFEYEVRSMGYWKTHNENWNLPVYIGAEHIETQGEAFNVFNLPNSDVANKLQEAIACVEI